MKFQINQGDQKGYGQWQVTVNGPEWKTYLQKARQRLIQNLKLPGFRPGKVPPHLIKQNLNDVEIFRQAHLLVFNQAYQYALQQNAKPGPYEQPRIVVKTIDHNQYVLLINFALPPNYQIKRYVGFEDIIKPDSKVTAAEVNQELRLLQSQLAMLQPKKGVVALGDQVKINFRGFINKEAFAGGTAKNFELEIGSQKLINGFEDQIIGMKVGDIKTINVTFPDDYPQPALAGKNADFKVTLNELFTKKLPPLNDQLALDYPDPQIKTLSQLKTAIKIKRQNQKTIAAREEFMDQLFRAIAADSQLNIDPKLIAKETRSLKKDFINELTAKNISLKEYKQRTKIDENYITKELKAEAQQRIENTIIIQHVQAEEKLTASPTAITAAYEAYSKQFNTPVAELKKGILPLERVTKNIVDKLTMDFLYDHNGPAKSKPKKAISGSKTTKTKPVITKSNAAKVKAVTKKTTPIKTTTSKSPTKKTTVTAKKSSPKVRSASKQGATKDIKRQQK